MPHYLTLDALIAALSSGSTTDRFEAARALGDLYLHADEQHAYAPPPWPEALTHLFVADKSCPGVADAFWGKVQFDCPDFRAAGAWMLAVLKQRGPLATLKLSYTVPVSLEFHAHEAFHGNAKVLREMLDLGFDDLVVMTLEHDALEQGEHRSLCDALIATKRDAAVGGAVLALLFTHGVIHPEGLKREIITEHRLKSGKPALSVDYRKIGNPPHLFLYSRDKDTRLSADELKEVLEMLVPAKVRGAEITRDVAAKDARFWLIPTFPEQVDTRFYANAYVVSVFDFSKAAPSIRIDLPKV